MEWGYLWECLHSFRFGPKFIKWLQLLYQAPTARIQVNGRISRPFQLSRGTRQGCLISPLLYALAVEPLAITLRQHPGVRGLRCGQLTEVISLYAEDMLLYLADAGPSLQTALQLITAFGTFSGLQINWTKSHILPLDLGVPSADQDALPLVRTNSIKYLGVHVSRSLEDYIPLNVEPLFQVLRAKTQTWSRLPLGIMGRINLVKMILLPKLLYIFWQAPLYLPPRIFKSMESIINMFIWGPSRHKLSWKILKCPTELGGAALPDLFLYYLASQLSHFFHFKCSDRERYSTLVCPQTLDSLSHPFQILFCGPHNSTRNDATKRMLSHHCRIWQHAVRIGQAPSPHSHTPLWHNSHMPELHSVPDHRLWVDKGIIYLSQVVSGGLVKSFQALRDSFTLPDHMLLRYYQLRHALCTQFRGSLPCLEIPLLMDIVLGEDSRKLISLIYTYLMSPMAESTALQLKSSWESDLGALSDEDWKEALSNCKTVSPKLSDRLTNLYILHRSYLTPYRISKYRLGHNPNCPSCNYPNASFFHLKWACPSIQGFWTQVIRFLHDRMGSPVSLCPRQCLLGLLSLPDNEKYLNTLLQETLFLARMQIARTWMRGPPPTLQQWIRAVNITLPYKKLLYIHRGCPDKYHKIWDRWAEAEA